MKKPKAKTPKSKTSKSPMMPTAKTKQDKMWEAEDDVRTLMRAEEIKKDAIRFKRAQGMAKKKAEEAARIAKL